MSNNCEEGNANGAIEIASLPLLSGCPDDAEFLLFGNAVGGQGTYKYARRRWDDVKACLRGKPPLIGIVGRGTAKDPVPNQSKFKHPDLVGLGSTNTGFIEIKVDNVPQSNFGANTSFYFDAEEGEIDLDMGQGGEWVAGSGLYIDLNQ